MRKALTILHFSYLHHISSASDVHMTNCIRARPRLKAVLGETPRGILLLSLIYEYCHGCDWQTFRVDSGPYRSSQIIRLPNLAYSCAGTLLSMPINLNGCSFLVYLRCKKVESFVRSVLTASRRNVFSPILQSRLSY